VGSLVSEFRPYGVDVSSGVEARLRVKDPDKIRAFVLAVRKAETQP
jgi:phosphoribosylanthranilate isomerase